MDEPGLLDVWPHHFAVLIEERSPNSAIEPFQRVIASIAHADTWEQLAPADVPLVLVHAGILIDFVGSIRESGTPHVHCLFVSGKSEAIRESLVRAVKSARPASVIDIEEIASAERASSLMLTGLITRRAMIRFENSGSAVHLMENGVLELGMADDDEAELASSGVPWIVESLALRSLVRAVTTSPQQPEPGEIGPTFEQR